MAASKASREAAMLPGVIEVIASIVGTGVVADPGFPVHMGNVGMARLVTVIAILFNGMRRTCCRLGPASGNGWMGRWRRFAVLRERGNRKHEQCCKS